MLAPTDAIGIQASSQVWVDHVDLSSDMDHGKVSLFLAPRLIHFCVYNANTDFIAISQD